MERLKKIAEVLPVKSSAVGKSIFGIGFEKLDRGVFDPTNAYDKVADLGVKWVRIQSGWAKTEKEKGVYDFSWLDSIVDNLCRRGLTPWLCLCYGNSIYDPEAGKVFGATGCPPVKNQEQKKAWLDYVAATVKHYAGKITWFEIWNEPDGKWGWKHGVNGTEYGNFVIATAQAIKEANPAAKVIGGASCIHKPEWLADMTATGAPKFMEAYSYHGYWSSDRESVYIPRLARTLCRECNPDIKFIQGETGTQSRSDGAGALAGRAWSPLRQAKFLARTLLSHMFEGVFINSYFSCVDMVEALNGITGDKSSYMDFGYFGVLEAKFNEEGIAVGDYTPKKSYRTLQVLASVFREDYEMKELPLRLFRQESPRFASLDDHWTEIISRGFVKPDGSCGLVYWKPVELLKSTYESSISVQAVGMKGTPHLISLLDGSVYEIPDTMMQQVHKDVIIFNNLPVTDYPLMLTFGNFAETVLL